MKRDLYRFAKARRDKEYYSTGIDGWWTQNPKKRYEFLLAFENKNCK